MQNVTTILPTGRREAIQVFMKRDGITREAAEERYKDGIDAVEEALACGFDPFTAWEEETGLELDYLI